MANSSDARSQNPKSTDTRMKGGRSSQSSSASEPSRGSSNKTNVRPGSQANQGAQMKGGPRSGGTK